MHTTTTRTHKNGYIRAEFGEHAIGAQAPCWSVTAEISSGTRFTDRSIHSCGCLHEDVRTSFPELAGTLRWHLSTGGIPMHYIANAKYWHDMHNGKVERRQYDPDPKVTFVSHVLDLGDGPEAWLALPWGEVETLLVARAPALRAAYKADVTDRMSGLVETLDRDHV